MHVPKNDLSEYNLSCVVLWLSIWFDHVETKSVGNFQPFFTLVSLPLFKSTMQLCADFQPMLWDYKRLTREGSRVALVPEVTGICVTVLGCSFLVSIGCYLATPIQKEGLLPPRPPLGRSLMYTWLLCSHSSLLNHGCYWYMLSLARAISGGYVLAFSCLTGLQMVFHHGPALGYCYNRYPWGHTRGWACSCRQ